jgi:hypothetical protein
MFLMLLVLMVLFWELIILKAGVLDLGLVDPVHTFCFQPLDLKSLLDIVARSWSCQLRFGLEVFQSIHGEGGRPSRIESAHV